MKIIYLTAIILVAITQVRLQSNVQAVVDAEHNFAALAAEKGTKVAFLANLTDDAVVFNPGLENGKNVWTARPASAALLSRAPNYADVSADGSLGFTTGNWEYRKKKDDAGIAFGEFITLWKRQDDGKYKFVLDIGIEHAKPEKYSTVWSTSNVKTDANIGKVSVEAAIKQFASTGSKKGRVVALEKFASDDIRLYREEQAPYLGKANARACAKTENGNLTLGGDGIIFWTSDLAYFVKDYTLIKTDKSIEKGKAVQIWKFQGGKWKIVLDILKPVSAK